MTIRVYKPSDLEQCRLLWAEMVQRHREIYEDDSIGGDDPGLEFDEHLSNVGPDRIWIAMEDDKAVGFVSLILDAEQAEIEPIVISAEHRSRGIGRELLNHAVEQARNMGVLCLSVKPVARNEEAIAFFHEAGFETIGHIQLFMWLGPDSPGRWKKGPELFGKQFEY